MTYPQAIQFLYQLRFFGTKLGLENTFRLAELAGNPHRRLRFIHVAGTNGKGSTCAMLESIYRAAGWRVGLFSSPHLVSFRERIQVDRVQISEADVVRFTEEIRGYLSAFPVSGHPTFFEVVTIMALRYFVEQGCELVIWETGLGGRLDATNIVTPLASVITNIQFDHEKWLGRTLAEIAFEKAGIVKPGLPVVTATDAPEALEVIQNTAARQQAPLSRVRMVDTTLPPLDTVTLPLLGDHQRMNAALALAVIRVLQPQLPVSAERMRRGLSEVCWPGRLQLVTTPSGNTLLLDGAHNPAGAQTLRRAVAQHFPGRRPALILGILRDKDWMAMCHILAPMAARVLLVPVASERTTLPGELLGGFLAGDTEVVAEACGSLAEALTRVEKEPFVVLSGSLHLVGEAMEWLQLSPGSATERDLNDWDAARTGATSPAVARL
jgi:dihydrofolate synthase / folylpolyglutamate synthase